MARISIVRYLFVFSLSLVSVLLCLTGCKAHTRPSSSLAHGSLPYAPDSVRVAVARTTQALICKPSHVDEIHIWGADPVRSKGHASLDQFYSDARKKKIAVVGVVSLWVSDELNSPVYTVTCSRKISHHEPDYESLVELYKEGERIDLLNFDRVQEIRAWRPSASTDGNLLRVTSFLWGEAILKVRDDKFAPLLWVEGGAVNGYEHLIVEVSKPPSEDPPVFALVLPASAFKQVVAWQDKLEYDSAELKRADGGLLEDQHGFYCLRFGTATTPSWSYSSDLDIGTFFVSHEEK